MNNENLNKKVADLKKLYDDTIQALDYSVNEERQDLTK